MESEQKEKPSLQKAARLVYDAIETAYRYSRDKDYVPTAEELQLFHMLEHSLYECYNEALSISQSMGQRVKRRSTIPIQ